MNERLHAALAKIDHCNAQDPNLENVDGRSEPKELVYGRRMTAWLDRLNPDASEPLRIAVRAQHLERWKRPREAYPMDRDGYRRWRVDCARDHAERVGAILRELGYSEEEIGRTQSIVRKENLKQDAEAQCLEDCAALVFLEHYFDNFIAEHRDYTEEKMLKILRRTWSKMSEAGHRAALGLEFSAEAAPWIRKALGNEP